MDNETIKPIIRGPVHSVFNGIETLESGIQNKTLVFRFTHSEKYKIKYRP